VRKSAAQSGISALAMFALAAAFEHSTVQWSGSFLVALLYMAVGAPARAPIFIPATRPFLLFRGAFRDDFGEHKMADLLIYPPGSVHGWQSRDGAILLVVWDAPTEAVQGAD
jgi:hypothetical protein